MSVKKITATAMLLAAALTIFVAEAQLPPPVPIPGVKLGLANVVTLAALSLLGRREAFAVLLGRIALGSIFAGQAVSFIYSLCGGLLCYIVMAVLIGPLGERLWVVSVFGAVAHNVGQIAAAAALAHSAAAWAYLPVLIISGVITGAFTGLCAQLIAKRLKRRKTE